MHSKYLVIPLLASVVLVAGCVSQAPSGSNGTSKTYSVVMKNFAFDPANLTIAVGDTVVWTNTDSAPHTVTSDSGSSGSELGSPSLAGGDTYSHTFSSPGTFSYHCSIHPFMTGNIIVR